MISYKYIILILIVFLIALDIFNYTSMSFPDFTNYSIENLDPDPDIYIWNKRDVLSLTLVAINITYELCYDLNHNLCNEYNKPSLPSNYKLIKQFYSQDCYGDSLDLDSNQDQSGGFIGCSAGAYLLRQGDNLIMLFRGARTLLDWSRVFSSKKKNITYVDADIFSSSGPLEKYNQMRDEIWEEISKQRDYKNIYVWGYSLGSTQATLFTQDLIANKMNGLINKRVKVITYILGTFKISSKALIDSLIEGENDDVILYRIETENEFTRYWPPRYWFDGPFKIVRFYPAPNIITIPMTHFGVLVGHNLVSYVESLIKINYGITQ